MAGLIYKELWHDKKVRGWSDAQVRLWLMCISYSEDHKSKGFLDEADITIVLTTQNIAPAVVGELIAARGLDRVGDRYRVHNYGERGKLSRIRAEAGKRGGQVTQAKVRVSGQAISLDFAKANSGVEVGVVERNEKIVPRGLCALLAELMLANGCKVPDPIPASWARDMDALLRIDDRIADEVAEVIRWSQQDAFWKANIHSPAKLRVQYDKLRLKMQTSGGNRNQQAAAGWDAIGERIKAAAE